MNVNGKTAVVTGAASGIGKALAQRFAKEGLVFVDDREGGVIELGGLADDAFAVACPAELGHGSRLSPRASR